MKRKITRKTKAIWFALLLLVMGSAYLIPKLIDKLFRQVADRIVETMSPAQLKGAVVILLSLDFMSWFFFALVFICFQWANAEPKKL